jgi:hypothetical protein
VRRDEEPDDDRDYRRAVVREVVRDSDAEPKYNTFVHAVFLAVLLGAGGIIWYLVTANAALDKRITLVEYKCLSQPLSRGSP